MKVRHFISLLVLAVFIAGCGGNDNNSPNPTGNNGGNPKDNPSFANDVQPIFTGNCAVALCHNSTAQQGLNLTAGVAYDNIVSVNSTEVPSLMIVHPSDASNSYLVHKIEGTQSVGERMPRGRTPLSSDDITTIKNWINQGAEEN